MIPWGWLIPAMIVGGVLVLLGALPFLLSGKDSECERCRAKREAACEACQSRLEQRIREHGNYRYLQGVADQGGPPVGDARYIAVPRGHHDVTGFYEEEVTG